MYRSSVTQTLGLLAALALLQALLPAAASARGEPDQDGRTRLLNEINAALESDSWESAEPLMAEFRHLYPATSRVRGWENGNEVVYLYPATRRLAESYAQRGDFVKALQVYEDEIAGLTIEVPHYSWQFIGLAIPYQLETGSASPDQIRSVARVVGAGVSVVEALYDRSSRVWSATCRSRAPEPVRPA